MKAESCGQRRSTRPLARLQVGMEELFACLSCGATVHNHRTVNLSAGQIEEIWRCYNPFVDRSRSDFLRTLALPFYSLTILFFGLVL